MRNDFKGQTEILHIMQQHKNEHKKKEHNYTQTAAKFNLILHLSFLPLVFTHWLLPNSPGKRAISLPVLMSSLKWIFSLLLSCFLLFLSPAVLSWRLYSNLVSVSLSFPLHALWKPINPISHIWVSPDKSIAAPSVCVCVCVCVCLFHFHITIPIMEWLQ